MKWLNRAMNILSILKLRILFQITHTFVECINSIFVYINGIRIIFKCSLLLKTSAKLIIRLIMEPSFKAYDFYSERNLTKLSTLFYSIYWMELGKTKWEPNFNESFRSNARAFWWLFQIQIQIQIQRIKSKCWYSLNSCRHLLSKLINAFMCVSFNFVNEWWNMWSFGKSNDIYLFSSTKTLPYFEGVTWDCRKVK